MDLVSVIVPIFNAEKFISRCIESVLAQTYINWELILVDDGSSDNSLNLCFEIARLDSRIRVFSHENRGVTATRKVGWQNSLGKWVVFVDADDTLTKDCLDILLRNGNTENFDIVNAAFKSVGGSGRLWQHGATGKMDRYHYLESFILNGTYGTVYASIYKKDLLQDSTFEIDPSIKIGEDVLQNIEIGLRVCKVLNINDVVYNYYDNEDSVMNRKIMHPSYIERFYDLGNDMLSREKGLMESLKGLRDRQKANSMLKAFFSPHLPEDLNYAKYLYSFLKERRFNEFEGRNKIFYLFIMMRQPALLKQTLKSLYVFKNYLSGTKIIYRQVLT